LNKILIIRFSSIGDIVLTTPIVRALRAKFEKAEIHFLTKSSFLPLVEENPYINKVLTLEKGRDKLLLNQLKTEKYDAVVDLHKNLRTLKIKLALRTKWCTFDKLNFKKWLFVNLKINRLPKEHIVERYFRCLAPLNLVNDHRGIDYFFPSDFFVDLTQLGVSKQEYTCIAIGGTYYTKQIPESLILDIIKRLKRPIVLLGAGKSDIEKVDSIVDKISDKNVVNLCSKLNIHESAYLIKCANSLITGDTGLMHIASSFDTPIKSIWGNTHRDFGMYAYRPLSDTIEDFVVPLPCNPCSKLGSDKCPKGHFKCMLEQNAEQIVKNC